MDEPPQLRWSGAFVVLPPSLVSSKNLGGDKMILPPSALEQLLAASPSRPPSGSTMTSLDRFNPYASHSGVSVLSEASQQLPNPLMFRLINPANGNIVHAGIREFSAEEGTVGLSPLLAEALGIGLPEEDAMDDQKTTQITIHAQHLPKGTYVRLRPLEAGYNPDDWKSLLERHLRDGFTTLTKDAILSVRGVKGETFKFLVDKLVPDGDGICVVDTDLEVDIEALNEEQARETMRQIMSKAQPGTAEESSTGGQLDIWKDIEGQVVPGEYVDYHLASWDRSRGVEIILSGVQDDESLDLFVSPRSAQQRARPREEAHVLGDLGSAEDGVKRFRISPTNAILDDAESLLISVHAIQFSAEPRGPLAFTIRAKVASVETNGTSVTDTEEHPPDEQQCKNCLQWVPKRTMMLHENFCRRNNTICPDCKTVFKKDSPEWADHWHCPLDSAHGNTTTSKAKHDAVFHTHRSCPFCAFTTNSLPDLARHSTTICPGKLILCRFCHLEVPQEGDPFNPSPEGLLSGMTAHELADGARTTECHLCEKIIRLRDMETHLKHHELDKVSRTKPAICRNVNCGRTLHGVGPKGQVGAGTKSGQGPGNDIGLCSICFGPLYVSMHDPEGKALVRRIERKYLGQLMTGCGKAHCHNEWCKTGCSSLGLPAKGSSAAAALPLVKPLLSDVPRLDTPFFFCADEQGQKMKLLAEMMAAEKGWDLEWCVAAAEAEKGGAEKMREWLVAWAPRAALA